MKEIINKIKINYCGPYTGTNWHNNSSTTTIDKSNCGE